MYDELIKQLRECTPEMNGEKTLWHQAADAIEELENRLNLWRQDKIRRWIPVTERLPEKYDRVLVFSKATRMGRSIDFINADGNWYTTPKVTHWMPIPELPKEET